MRYSPAEGVVVEDVTPVAWLVAVTMAPGTTALAGSNTVPVRSPEVVCAKLKRLKARNTTAPAPTRFRQPKSRARNPVTVKLRFNCLILAFSPHLATYRFGTHKYTDRRASPVMGSRKTTGANHDPGKQTWRFKNPRLQQLTNGSRRSM